MRGDYYDDDDLEECMGDECEEGYEEEDTTTRTMAMAMKRVQKGRRT